MRWRQVTFDNRRIAGRGRLLMMLAEKPQFKFSECLKNRKKTILNPKPQTSIRINKPYLMQKQPVV